MGNDHKPQCEDLPESPWRYFTRPPGTVLVPIAELEPTRARPKGIRNAEKFMVAACRGDNPKRKPITIAPDGKIVDGNSTYAVAKKAGWTKIPVLVDPGLNPPRRSNAPRSLTRESYPSIFGDTDGDTIPDVDDPRPFEAGDTRSIEEVRLSDEIGELLEARESFVPATREVVDRLEGIGIPGAEVQARVKTPFSLINKLRRKRMGTLTDIAASRIVVPDLPSLKIATGVIEGDFEVLQKEDFYKEPLAGYRAIHYIVRAHGVPVEVQVKTWRMSSISDASHTAYKRGLLNADEMDRLTELAAAADAGDTKAASQIDPLIADTAALQRTLTKAPNPRQRRQARRLSNGGD